MAFLVPGWDVKGVAGFGGHGGFFSDVISSVVQDSAWLHVEGFIYLIAGIIEIYTRLEMK